ncbi:hypothetical protein WDU94_014770 [Cyamophila willieti]
MQREWECYELPQTELAIQNAVIITQSPLCPLVIDPRGHALKWMRNMTKVIPLTHNEEVKIYDAHFEPLLENLQETSLISEDCQNVLETALKEGYPILLKNVTIEDIEGPLSPYIRKHFVEEDSEVHIVLDNKKTVPYNDKFRLFLMTKVGELYPPEIFARLNIIYFSTIAEKGLENEFLDLLMNKERPEETDILNRLRERLYLNEKRLNETDKEIVSLLNQDVSSESTVLDNKDLFNALEAWEGYHEAIEQNLEEMDPLLDEYDGIKQVYHSVSARVISPIPHHTCVHSFPRCITQCPPESSYLSVTPRSSPILLYLIILVSIRSPGISLSVRQSHLSYTSSYLCPFVPQVYHSVSARVILLYLILNDLDHFDPLYVTPLDAYIKLFEISVDKSEKSDELQQRVINIIDHFTYAVYKNMCPRLYEHHKLLFSFLLCVRLLPQYKEQEGIVFSNKEYEFLLHGVVRVNRLTHGSTSKPDWITDLQWDNLTELTTMPGFRGLLETITGMPKEWIQWYRSAEPEKKFLPPWENDFNVLQKILVLRCLRPDRLKVLMTQYVNSMLGPQFTEPLTLDPATILSISSKATPILFLPSLECDHMISMKQLAKELSMENKLAIVCLGPGQISVTKERIKSAMETGGWVYIVNCHANFSWLNFYLSDIVENLQDEILEYHPRGIKAKMADVYDESFSPAMFNASTPQYQKLMFTLNFLHAVLVERKKYGTLGWNTIYYFKDVEFDLSKNIITSYFNEYTHNIPWDSVQRLLGDAIYGGHMPNEWDRRVSNAHCKDLLVEACLIVDK